jgi:hypothetical protein
VERSRSVCLCRPVQVTSQAGAWNAVGLRVAGSMGGRRPTAFRIRRRLRVPVSRRLAMAVLAVAALAVAALVSPAAASAQELCLPPQPCRPAPEPASGPSDIRVEVTGVAINALLGGLTTGIPAALRGEPFARAFAAGAAGGSLIYGGKRVAVERFAGAGLLGREIAAVGGSVVQNVARGERAVSVITIPVGPLRLELGPGRAPRARLDLATLIAAGALVFRSESRLDGMHAAGVVLVPDPSAHDYDQPGLLAHERVHVLQYDQAHLSWGEPAEGWLLQGTGPGRWMNRHVDLGLTAAARGMLNLAVEYHARPWEREAHMLAGLGDPSGPEPAFRLHRGL